MDNINNTILNKFNNTENKLKISKEQGYPTDDLGSVFTHYDPATGRNVSTENVLNGGK